LGRVGVVGGKEDEGMRTGVGFYGGVGLFRLLLAGQVGWEIFLY
jgi:hypothetical protein